MRDAGVRHIGLHLRCNRRPLDETLAEIAAEVLPAFHAQADASVA
ncbi:luciferase family domain protein [Burkholderia ubonensis MSMB22]|nr:luciferase family domain protein [Burkholderia ubonensis MSMB22]